MLFMNYQKNSSSLLFSITNEFLKSELKSYGLKLTNKIDGGEGVDFLIRNNQLYLHNVVLKL